MFDCISISALAGLEFRVRRTARRKCYRLSKITFLIFAEQIPRGAFPIGNRELAIGNWQLANKIGEPNALIDR
jgi:hypothetical protein